jgi:hypothetical protein
MDRDEQAIKAELSRSLHCGPGLLLLFPERRGG